jgi:transcriptional regulator of acetoin/glycerol metabolism
VICAATSHPAISLPGRPRAGGALPGDEPIIPLQDAEKTLLVRTLKKYGWFTAGKKAAAQEPGIAPGTLYYKIKQYQLAR